MTHDPEDGFFLNFLLNYKEAVAQETSGIMPVRIVFTDRILRLKQLAGTNCDDISKHCTCLVLKAVIV